MIIIHYLVWITKFGMDYQIMNCVVGKFQAKSCLCSVCRFFDKEGRKDLYIVCVIIYRNDIFVDDLEVNVKTKFGHTSCDKYFTLQIDNLCL